MMIQDTHKGGLYMRIMYVCSVMLCISSLMQAGEEKSTERKTTTLKSLRNPSHRDPAIELFDVSLDTPPLRDAIEIRSEQIKISPFMSFLLRFFDFFGCGGDRGKQPYSPVRNHYNTSQTDEDHKEQNGDDIR